MTKYREIIRLAGLNLSQTNIALNCNVSKTTVNKVLKATREKDVVWPLEPNLTDTVLEKMLFPDSAKAASSSRNGCRITPISARNSSATGSAKSSCGQNTLRSAALLVMSRLCIPNSATISSRMSRNTGQPCTLTANRGSRLKSTG